MSADRWHCLMPYPPAPVPHAASGPLSGLRLAVKDIFDVAGYPTGCGCPLKLAQSGIKPRTASAALALLEAGAEFVGKTHTDELAWSMYGMNAHFGTPVNPAAPDRIPGGSSSGSAVAVAAGLADIAIGSDTGGSVRAPASFCGIWGIRPSHGALPLDHTMELAASYDTCGIFARDGATLLRGLQVLLPDPGVALDAPDLLRPADMWDQLAPAPRAVLERAFAGQSARELSIFPQGVEAAYATFLTTVNADARDSVLPFIRDTAMPLVRGIDGRVAAAEALSEPEIAQARADRAVFAAELDARLGPQGVLLAPVVHDAPFRLDAPLAVFDSYRHHAMRLLCVAGLAGLPQVVFPAGQVEGAPYGAALIGPRGSDLALVALACEMTKGQTHGSH
ncbi:MAG TPA: amidase [Citreicella sp.]|jgi:amidase|nr:amidase [Citreicella sp.]